MILSGQSYEIISCTISWLAFLSMEGKIAEIKEQLQCYPELLNMILLFYVCFSCIVYEPGHEKMCLISYANNNADQPAHLRSLISTFVVRCLDSIISLVSIAEISRL